MKGFLWNLNKDLRSSRLRPLVATQSRGRSTSSTDEAAARYSSFVNANGDRVTRSSVSVKLRRDKTTASTEKAEACFGALNPKENKRIALFLTFNRCVVIVTAAILAGCVSTPLETQKQQERLAHSVGFEPDEIGFMNYCFFEEVQNPNSENQLKGKRGIVAITDSELCLVDGALRKAPKNFFLKIPLSQIDGASNLDGLIQLKHQGRIIVLFLYNWNDFIPNHELSQKLYESLIFAGVPGFDANDYYSFSRFQSPPQLKRQERYSQRNDGHNPYKFPDQYPHGTNNQ